MKHCNGCPILIHHEKGAKADSYGCLPTIADVQKWFLETGKVWSCHENEKQPCVGFLKQMKMKKINVSINKNIVLIKQDYTLNEIYNE